LPTFLAILFCFKAASRSPEIHRGHTSAAAYFTRFCRPAKALRIKDWVFLCGNWWKPARLRCAKNPQQQLQAPVWFVLLLLAIAELKIVLMMMMSAVNLWKAQQLPRTQ
jgi:hypothetical protein